MPMRPQNLFTCHDSHVKIVLYTLYNTRFKPKNCSAAAQWHMESKDYTEHMSLPMFKHFMTPSSIRAVYYIVTWSNGLCENAHQPHRMMHITDIPTRGRRQSCPSRCSHASASLYNTRACRSNCSNPPSPAPRRGGISLGHTPSRRMK